MMYVILVGKKGSFKSDRLNRGIKEHVANYSKRRGALPFNYSFIDYERDGSGKIDTEQITKDKIPIFFIQDGENQTLVQTKNVLSLLNTLNLHRKGDINIFEE